MTEKKPDPKSLTTMRRATALTWARGCEEWNDCWWDCYSCALDAIVEDTLDDWSRQWATSSEYWHATHRSASVPVPTATEEDSHE